MKTLLNVDYLKNNSLSIKEFGIGFIQIKLNEKEVLNFYTDKVPKFDNNEAPHNHQRDFISRILFGSLEETLYHVFENDKGSYAYCGCGDINKNITEKYSYEIKEITYYNKGDMYYRHKNDFHSVAAINNTITFIVKDLDVKHDAIVIGEKIDHITSNMNEDELWDIVDNILKEAKINCII